ncbi:circadian-associated transcriptional repressor [Anguilla rostrata]|uniref:circadian-associated transcriptional repressor n=1 Tax=Anguilla rostrata TaxID=7938 RepID=UPI0030D28B93
MSASDSDSIDWLASDDEDCESTSELVCKGGASATKMLPLPVSSGAESRVAQPGPQAAESDCSSTKEGASCRDGGACGTSSRSAEPCGGTGCGLLLLGQEAQCGPLWRSALYVPDGLPGEGPRRAPKRPRSTEAQVCWPWPHPVRTSNDELFARKCSELQCYVPHLSSILSGLRSGRYRERLSSFQESVAMDRIQRIMGVLRNPCMGERYINIILKVEEMLRSWFPNVKPKERLGSEQTDETTPSKRLKPCPAITAESPAELGVSNEAFGAGEPVPPGGYSATHLKWLHTSPICSPSAQRALGRLRRWRAEAAGAQDVTQDSSVSSSTDPPPGPQHRPPGKIVAPCLERLLKSTESIITRKSAPATLKESSWS